MAYQSPSYSSDLSNSSPDFDPPQDPKPKIKHNNQTTVFMVYQINKKRFCLLHDNRIFHFSKEAKRGDLELQSEAVVAELEVQETVDCLNDLLTTAKYRGIQGFYLLFRFVDYGIFVYLIYCTFDAFKTTLDGTYIPLMVVIAMELLYDVLENLTKLWPMERLKLWIAVSLYLLYTGLFSYVFPNPRTDSTHTGFWSLLGTRFIVFIFETVLDIALDMEIHNDIMQHPSVSDWFPVSRHKDLDKLKLHFLGSQSSLLFTPVRLDPKNYQHYYSSFQWILYTLGVIIIWIFVVPVALVLAPLLFILLMIAMCCCQCDCLGGCCPPVDSYGDYINELLQV